MISREDGKKEEMLRGAAKEEVVEEGLGLRLRIARFMKSQRKLKGTLHGLKQGLIEERACNSLKNKCFYF